MRNFRRVLLAALVALALTTITRASPADPPQPQPPVAVHVTPSNPHALLGVQNAVTVLLEVNCSAAAAADQAPLRSAFELALVLDRSGSMAGDKLKYAKQAIHNIIDNLLPTDVVHIVVFDDAVDTVIASGRTGPEETPRLHATVSAIQDSGMTNLHGGLMRGYDLLGELPATDGIKRLPRLFLFSDGVANVGVTDHGAITSLVRRMRSTRDILTSAFGLGLDFDEPLVRGIASEGGGEYFFVGNAEDTERVVSIGLKGVANSVGVDPVLTVSGTNGAVVQEVLGQPGVALQEGIPLRPLRAGMGQRVLVRLAVTPPADAGPGEHLAVLQWQLAYKPVAAGGETATLRGDLKLWLTADSVLTKVEDARVRGFRELVDLAEREDHVRRLLETGKAAEALTAQSEILATYASSPVAGKRALRAARFHKTIQDHGADRHSQMESRFVSAASAVLSDYEDEM